MVWKSGTEVTTWYSTRLPETVDHEGQNLLVGLGVEQLIAMQQVLAALLVAIRTLGSQPVERK